jgi:predicted RNA binding protein YcfA (HicA-like mRNA interferase family)
VKRLAAMRANPRDWRIEDLEALARAVGISVRKPSGSHVLFSHPKLREALSVPARRPIKPVYIVQFVCFVDRARII